MNSAVLTASLTGRIQFFCYGALLRTTSTSCCEPLQPARDASIPPLLYGDPDAPPGPRPDRPRGVNRGYEPSGATCARPLPDILGDVPVTCGGGPEGRAPMEVPDLHAALPNYRDPTPPAESPATVGSRAGGLAPRIRTGTIAGCMPVATAPGAQLDALAHPEHFHGVTDAMPRSVQGLRSLGEASCHPARGNESPRRMHVKQRRCIAFAGVTPTVTVHVAVTRA